MRVKIISIGKNLPIWLQTGFNEYCKRLSKDIKLQLIEIPLSKRSKNCDLKRLISKEGQQMQSCIAPDDHVLAMDLKGKQFNTETLAQKFTHWQSSALNPCFLIGGPEGLDPEVLLHAHEKWSLSALTFPHPLVRLILIEQIYRAQCIIKGHPYHK